MSDEWNPIDHRPPLKRIETSPQYTPAPPSIIPDHIQQQLEAIERSARLREADRMWSLVVQSSTGGVAKPAEVDEPKPVDVVYPPYEIAAEWVLQPIYYPAMQPETFVFPVYEGRFVELWQLMTSIASVMPRKKCIGGTPWPLFPPLMPLATSWCRGNRLRRSATLGMGF